MKNRLKHSMFAICLASCISPASRADFGEHTTTLYTLSNEVKNAVYAYTVDNFGNTKVHAFSTGGQGTAASLANQGALAISADQDYLFAVNAGSNEVSVFKIEQDRLILLDHEVEKGVTPVSVTVSNDIVYVVNSGDDSIFGYKFDRETDSLQPLSNSYTKLGATGTGAAEIAFNTDGDTVVVTEKALNTISSFVLDWNGIPVGAPHTITSAHATPYGFAFGKHENFFVSEAAGGSTLSSYALNQDGSITVIDGAVPTNQASACWVANTPNGRLSFTANAGANSISSFAIDRAGSLTLLDATAATPNHPLDLAVSKDGSLLFSLNGGDQTIAVFGINQDGKLNEYKKITSVPKHATGLVLRKETSWFDY